MNTASEHEIFAVIRARALGWGMARQIPCAFQTSETKAMHILAYRFPLFDANLLQCELSSAFTLPRNNYNASRVLS